MYYEVRYNFYNQTVIVKPLIPFIINKKKNAKCTSDH